MRRGLFASALLTLATAAGAVSAAAGSVESAGNAGAWSDAARPISGRESHTATLIENGTILIAGGTNGKGKALASAEVYNPVTNRWTPAGTMATTRLDHTATLLPGSKVLVVGGRENPNNRSFSLASAELYDPTSNDWSPAAPMSAGRAQHTATLLSDGRVLVVGGVGAILQPGGRFYSRPTSAEIYDPQLNRWSPAASMAEYRLDQTTTMLRDGRVLVAGGQNGLTGYTSAEIYDPVQDRWSAAAPMISGRFGHAATLLANGDVMVAGGAGRATGLRPREQAVGSAEIYDPSFNRWSQAASMNVEREEHTATTLRNGSVLVVGTTRQSRAEIYDPAHNVWSWTGPDMERYNHTATLLPDGRILVVGGFGLDSVDSVLLYDPLGGASLPRQPTDGQVVALLLAGLLGVMGLALLIAARRRRLTNQLNDSGGRGDSDDWIT